jgi:hypothetical protein
MGCRNRRLLGELICPATGVLLSILSTSQPVCAEQVRILDNRGLQRLVAEVKGESGVRISARVGESRPLSSCAAVSPDGITVPGEVRPFSECLFLNLPSGTWQIRIDPGDFQWRASMTDKVADAQRR